MGKNVKYALVTLGIALVAIYVANNFETVGNIVGRKATA